MFSDANGSGSRPSLDESFAILAGGIAAHHSILERMAQMLDFLCRRYTIDNFDVWTPEFVLFVREYLVANTDDDPTEFEDDVIMKCLNRATIEKLIIDYLNSKSAATDANS